MRLARARLPGWVAWFFVAAPAAVAAVGRLSLEKRDPGHKIHPPPS